MLAHLLDRPRRGDQLVLGRRGRSRRSTGRSPAATRCARAPRPRRRRRASARSARVVLPRTIESSTTTTRLPATSASGLNFSRMPCSAQLLVGLDERAADVAVLDQPLAERDAESRARSRSRRACPSRGSAGRGRPRPAPPRRAARPSARARRAPRRRRAACRAARGRRTRRCRARRRSAGSTAWIARSAVLVDRAPARRGATSRTNSAPTRSSAHVSEATTQSSCRCGRARAAGSRAGRGSAISVPSESATIEYAPSSRRIAFATASSSGASSFAISAAISSLSEVVRERDARPARSSSRSSRRVDEVAVVAERDRARAAVLDERLRVRPLRRAGRRVARVPDRDLAVQAAQLLLVEDLRDEARGRAAPSAGPARRRRSRPTPGRGAGARRARST